TNYCCEPIPKRLIDVNKESVRYLADGSRIRLTYQKSENSSITRVRDIVLIYWEVKDYGINTLCVSTFV
ncbi:hypothetical protein, partial [Klebsiella pneumoniae]|uniref:hypothetical protein n=1 Tax=Klebsiella pneumoniae TaxID=573 RepID=UPI001D0DFACA